MTDIVERLRQNNRLVWDHTMDLQEEAAIEIEALRAALHRISLASHNSRSSMHGIGVDARKALEASYD
jgi:hypothetical protein